MTLGGKIYCATPAGGCGAAPAVVAGSDPSVQRVLRALEQLRRSDPNHYVRIRSAAALRQIGPAEVQ